MPIEDCSECMGQLKATSMGMFRSHKCIGSIALYMFLMTALSAQCEGQYIEWAQLRCLYKRNRPMTDQPSLAMLHKLKFEHVNLTTFSKMRVDLAAQVSPVCYILCIYTYLIAYTCLYMYMYIPAWTMQCMCIMCTGAE